MGFVDDFIYNKRAARLLGCRVRDLHMRSVFIPSRKVVYFCNPKVAGSSIIQNLLRLDKTISPSAVEDHNLPQSRRRISSLRAPKSFWECLTDPDAFRFSFVRNPYGRILSCYRDKIESGREPRFLSYIGIKDRRTPSFLEFLKRIEQQNPKEMNRHWMPQSVLIPGTVTLSMLGRFEDLDGDMTLLLERLGLEDVRRVDPHRTNTGNEFRLSAEEVSLVNRIYAEDFRRFSYVMIAET